MEDDFQNKRRFSLARIEERVRDHERRLCKAEDHYVSHAQFAPVAKLVYGLAAATLLAVAGALIKVVIAS